MRFPFICFCFLLAAAAWAGNDAENRALKLVYHAPEGAESGMRLSSVSRGGPADMPSLFVLAPDHVGLTLREQPDLFWYQSKPSNVRFELTMAADGVIEPVLSLARSKAAGSGIMRVDLAEHNVRLRKGVEYQWSVALIVDPNNRSKDMVASGYVKREVPTNSLSARLVKQSKLNLVQIYSDSGVWYDAFETISDLIAMRPGDLSLLELRAILLDQVGLPEPADFDRESMQKQAAKAQ